MSLRGGRAFSDCCGRTRADYGSPNDPRLRSQFSLQQGKVLCAFPDVLSCGAHSLLPVWALGATEPPADHKKAALAAAAKIVPLDADGKPAPDGKIVLLGIGMSNTTMEYSRFKQLADADADKSPRLVIVDGAQGGQAAAPLICVWITARTFSP